MTTVAVKDDWPFAVDRFRSVSCIGIYQWRVSGPLGIDEENGRVTVPHGSTLEKHCPSSWGEVCHVFRPHLLFALSRLSREDAAIRKVSVDLATVCLSDLGAWANHLGVFVELPVTVTAENVAKALQVLRGQGHE